MVNVKIPVILPKPTRDDSDAEAALHFFLCLRDSVFVALGCIVGKQGRVELQRIVCFEIRAIQRIQRHTYGMGSIEEVGSCVVDDRPYLFCCGSITGVSSKARQELLSQFQYLFCFLLGDRFNSCIGIRGRETGYLQNLHDLFLEDDEAGSHFACLDKPIKCRNAVVEMLACQEDR